MFTSYLYFRPERYRVIYSNCTAAVPGVANTIHSCCCCCCGGRYEYTEISEACRVHATGVHPAQVVACQERVRTAVHLVRTKYVRLYRVGRRKSLQQQCSTYMLCIRRHSCTTTRHYSKRRLVYRRLLRCIGPGVKMMALH